MLVALIDDGINTLFCPDLSVSHDLVINQEGVVSTRSESDNILTSHGTICAKIISTYAPRVEYASIKIFHHEDLRSPCDQLVAALSWCIHKRIPIVHLSVGSSLLCDYSKIQPLISKMIHQRQIVIAAHSNHKQYSIPACIGGVFGVVHDKGLANDAYHFTSDCIMRNTLRASSLHHLHFTNGKTLMTPYTNSYAAPTVTAAVCNLLMSKPLYSLSVADVYRYLSCRSTGPFYSKPDFLFEACIVNPYNADVYDKHLLFRDCGVYDAASEIINECKTIIHLPANNNTIKMDGLFWNYEHCYKIDIRQLTPEAISIPCPVVNVYGNGGSVIHFLCQLRDYFFMDGYQCAAVTDDPNAVLYGLEYAYEQKGQYINFLFNTYDVDLIIYHSSTQLIKDTICEEEYYIEINNDAPVLSVCNLRVVKPDFSTNEVQYILNEIVRYFEGETRTSC